MYTLAIIDDELHMRRAILSSIDMGAMNLSLAGEASNGEEGLRLLLEQTPDIALVDINMPRKDGLTMIKEAQDAGCETQFLLLTGYDDFSYARQAVGLNVVDYLLKPINRQSLAEALSRAQRRLSRQHEVNTRISSLEQKNTELLISDFFSSLMAGATVPDETLQSLLHDFGIDSSLFDNTVLVCADCPVASRDDLLEVIRKTENRALVFRSAIGLIYVVGLSESGLKTITDTVQHTGGKLGVSKTFSGLEGLTRACNQCHAALRKAVPTINTQVSDAVKTYIEAHLSDPELSINTIAQATFITYSYLCYCFKRDCGTTINDYITQRRIDTAKQLFISGARNINRVSLDVGYNSNSYFSKSFKKIVGVSPSDFIANLH